MASIQERLNRLRGESSEASVYERLNHLRQIGQSQETESAAGGAGPAPAQRTVKSAPPAALPESKGKALTLPKAGERGFLAGGVSVEGSPFLYGSERAAAALLGAGEGVTDFIGSGFYKGVQGISSLGGLAPNPVSEWAGRNADAFLENSVTRDYEESIRERYRPSQGAENLTGIGQTIVQMLPGIGASKIVSAAGKGLNAAQAISRGENVGRALFGLQAAGNSASQAKAEGADTGQALAFGAASGALETAIEGIAGGIPGLGGGKVGKIAEAVKASPLVSRALDIAGEGGEEALSTFLTPYIQRAIYNPEAENATLGEIGQSALMGAVAAGVLQGGLELPGAISNAASDIRTTRRAIGSNQDIARRATANIQAGQNMARYSSGNPLAAMLPTGEEALAGKRAYLPGSPVYQRNVVDNPSGAGYDGGNQTETGGVTYERGKETSAALEGVHGASLQAETPGSEETYRGRMGGVLEEGRRVQQPESWAQGHIIRTPSAQAQNAASRAKQYSSDVFIVDDAALKSRNPNAWAVTSGGKIYISDAVPAELADAVGYHESVHVLRQQDNEAYHGFLSDESRFLNRSSETAMDLLDLVVDARFPGKSIMDLTPEEAAITYDELNALVWGYHKADPENARAQFSGAFQDYDAYIQELDTIMEGARQPVENQTGVGPAQAQGPESSVGAARANFTGDTERGFSKNLATDRARHPDIQEDFQLDPEKYFRLSNKKTLQKAQDIFSTGLDNARSTVEQALGRAQEGRKLAPEIVPLSKMVADALAAQGDMNGARRILAGVAAELTSAGQLGQAAKILRDADPKTTIESVERIVDNLNDALGGKNKIVVDKALIDEYDRQTDNAGRADVLDQIYDSVASQIPSTPLDKFNALRYTNMLGNIKTQVRNVGGNLIMKGVRTGRVKVQAAIEALAQKRGMDFERTTSFTRDREIYKLAKEEFDAAQAEIMGEQKYSYNGKSVPAAIHNRRTIFKNNGTWGTDPHSPAYLLRKGTDFLWKLPEGYRRLTNWAMEKGDIVFAKSAYADALSRYLKANGITVERYKSGDVDYELLERAQAYAVREAQEATFRDSNAFSDMIASIGFRKADTLPKKVVNTALQGSLPFRRTPANVTVRAVE